MPAEKLTDARIRAATAPEGGRLELTDLTCQGLRVRITAGGVRTFSFLARDASGKVARSTLGRFPDLSLGEARRIADRLRAQSSTGAPAPTRRAARIAAEQGATFRAMADSFFEKYVEPRKRSTDADRRHLNEAKARWGDLPAGAIKRADIVDHLDAVAKRGPVTANRHQSTLSKLWRWALDSGLVEANPIAGLAKRGGRETARDRALSDQELLKLWQVLDDDSATTVGKPLRLALQMIVLTAARPGEVAGLPRTELHDLDGRAPEWRLPGSRTKNGRPHIVPLSPQALDVIAAAGKLGSKVTGKPAPYTFASKQGGAVHRSSLAHALPELIEAAKIEPLTAHDLRRTSATLMGRLGTPPHIVELILNHTPPGVGKVYNQHVYLDERREALDRLGERIAALAALG